MLDALASAVLTFLLAPLLIVISLAVLTMDGPPIFFRQQRLGCKGKVFTIFKFRTMVNGADQLLEKEYKNATGKRVTRLGRILRTTSLDELPQIVNILRGEMSFIGPRPALPAHLPRYTSIQRRRLEVLPGITGLAQVRGRNNIRWTRRIRYDIFYIDHMGFALDAMILFETVIKVISAEGMVLDRNPEKVDDLG